MRAFLEQIPLMPLALGAALILLAPFHPMPHVVEKFLMLKQGALHRPLDIADLAFHLLPLLLLAVKLLLRPPPTPENR